MLESLDDLLPVHVSRAPPCFREFLAPAIASLRGMTQLMVDMCQNPSGLPRLLSKAQAAVIAAQEKGEQFGDLSTADQYLQSCPYSNCTVAPA